MNKYKISLILAILLVVSMVGVDIYIGMKTGEWFNLISFAVTVIIGYLLASLVETRRKK